MRMIFRRVSAAAAITGVGLFCFSRPGLADPGWGSVDCNQSPSQDCEVSAGSGGTSGDGAGYGNGGSASGASATSSPSTTDANLANCRYRSSDYRPPPGAAGSGALPGGVWLDGLCSATDVIQTPEYVAAVTPAEIARLARNQLRLPTPTIATNPPGDQLVNLPTWLWLSSGWDRVSATASVPGVSVTAVATPTSATWSMGDGTIVTCAGAGSPFRPPRDPAASSPDCGHTYRTSSANQPGEAFPVTATVHWTVTWSGAGQSGTFPDLTTTGNTTFRVAESQALNTGSG